MLNITKADVGRYFRRRDGEIELISSYFGEGTTYPFNSANGFLFSEDGSCFSIRAYDLVERIEEPSGFDDQATKKIETLEMENTPMQPSATQVGGNHWTKLAIQPSTYSMANNLDPMQHTAIKYITRFRDKNGREDLEKAKHVIELLIEWEYEGGKEKHQPVNP